LLKRYVKRGSIKGHGKSSTYDDGRMGNGYKHRIQNSGFRQQAVIKSVFCVLYSVLWILSPLLPTHVSASEIDRVVDTIQKKLISIQDIKGRFSQSSYLKDLEQTQKYSGTFFIKRPSNIMWVYDPPRDEAIYINESTTWIYKRSSNQVIKSTLKKGSYFQTPIAMLTNFEHMKDDFNISIPENNALQLVPKHKIGNVKTVVIELTEGEFPLKMFTIIDTYGNMVMIELSDIKINSGLRDSLFKFTPPEGSEIYTVD